MNKSFFFSLSLSLSLSLSHETICDEKPLQNFCYTLHQEINLNTRVSGARGFSYSENSIQQFKKSIRQMKIKAKFPTINQRQIVKKANVYYFYSANKSFTSIQACAN